MSGLFVNHIHVFPAEVRRGNTPDAFLRIAADLGVEGGVFFAPFSFQWPGGDPNGWLARVLGRIRGYVGMGTLDPEKPARDQVSRIFDLGLVGIKIHAAAQHFPLNCEWIMDAYAQMERLGLIADLHLGVHGYRLKDYHPLVLDDVAYRFPALQMILEHVGGWHYMPDAVAVIQNHQLANKRRLYAGITSVFDLQRQPAWYLGPEGVAEVAWQIGFDRLIYGAGFPRNDRERIAADIALIREMNLPEEAKSAMLGGNLRELLGLKRSSPPKRRQRSEVT